MQVIHAPNQLSLQTDFIALIGEDDRLSPHEIIAQNALCFSGPVLCQVNEGFWLRADWDARLPAGATVRFIVVPQGDIGRILASIAVVALSMYAPYALGIAGTLGGTLLSAAIAIGGMLLIGMLFPVAKSGDMGTPDTMYSLSNSNRMRPGEPYAERFGRTQFYPDVACSYLEIVNNEQYLHALLILGIGHFSDIAVYVDKTPLTDYSGATYTVIPPGEDPDFYVAWTSSEAGGQELSTSWITYVVNPRGTSATTIKYDVVFSGGLIGYNDEGDAYSVSVPVIAEARRIDAYGNALGDWIQHDSYTFRAASKDPLRFSRGCAVPSGAGRYEFRVRRTSSPSESSRVVDRCSLGGLRAFGCLQPTLDDVTLLRVTIKATNQLNSDVASKIQVHATRNLFPVTGSGFGTTRAASRSIVDFVAYAVTSDNGGQLGDSILIWDVLAELRADLIAAGWNFDWGWTSRVSVMEACSTAAACGLAIMYTPGGKVCLAQDTLQVSYGVPFTDDDFDPGSLEITTSFRTAASNTCIRVTYFDWNSGQEETVDCYDADGSDFNPKEISLNGCTDRQHAYEIGMRLYRNMMRSTVAVGWSTGLKGNLPSVFQWVPVSSTAANILASGIVVAVETGKIWLSEPVDFGGESSGWLRLATPAGGHAGPYTVTPTEHAHCVAGTISDLKTLKADGPNKAQQYIFGTSVKTVRLVKIMAIRPQGQNSIELAGQVVDETIYTDAIGTAPELGGDTEECLTSMCLSLTENPDVTNGYRAYWAFAATKFKIEVSVDSGEYELLADHYAGTSIPFVREVAFIVTVRVTPYLNGELYSDGALTASIEYTPMPSLSVAVDTDSADASWTAVENADSYTVQLWEGGVLRGTREVSTTSTSITADQIVAMGGPPWTSFEIRVAANVGDRQSEFDSEAVTAPNLAAPGNFVCEQVNPGSAMLTWARVPNATGYRVYMDETQGFDPETEGVLVAVVSATGAIVSLELTEPYAYYFRVAAVNDWHRNRSGLVFSDELEVASAATGYVLFAYNSTYYDEVGSCYGASGSAWDYWMLGVVPKTNTYKDGVTADGPSLPTAGEGLYSSWWTAAISYQGRILAATGRSIYLETGVGTGVFAVVATIAGRSMDPAFILVSPDESKCALGIGYVNPLLVFPVSILDSGSPPVLATYSNDTWTPHASVKQFDLIEFSYSAVWWDNQYLIIDTGQWPVGCDCPYVDNTECSFGSGVGVVDTDTANPLTHTGTGLVSSIPAASSGLALDNNGHLLVGLGFQYNGTNIGQIKIFAHDDIQDIIDGGAALTWSSNGTVIGSAGSAGMMCVDGSNNLYVGGGDAFHSGTDCGYLVMIPLGDTSDLSEWEGAGTAINIYSSDSCRDDSAAGPPIFIKN